MQGVIADGVPHIHCTVGDQVAISGHMHEGCRVLYVCEMTVIEFVGLDLTRSPGTAGADVLREKCSAA